MAREKEKRAYELWVQGATPGEIAATTDPETGDCLYAGESGARAAIERAKTYMGQIDDMESLRRQALDGLMAQRRDLHRMLDSPHPLIDRYGKPVMVPVPQADGSERMEAAEDFEVRGRIHDRLLRVDKRIAELAGLDAAARLEISEPIDVAAKIAELRERMNSIKLLPREEILRRNLSNNQLVASPLEGAEGRARAIDVHDRRTH